MLFCIHQEAVKIAMTAITNKLETGAGATPGIRITGDQKIVLVVILETRNTDELKTVAVVTRGVKTTDNQGIVHVIVQETPTTTDQGIAHGLEIEAGPEIGGNPLGIKVPREVISGVIPITVGTSREEGGQKTGLALIARKSDIFDEIVGSLGEIATRTTIIGIIVDHLDLILKIGI